MNPHAARRVLVDCDPGVDDALALLLAFASPEIDLSAITVSGGNVGLDRTLRNAAGIAALAGSHAPVVAGARHPILGRYGNAAHVHGEDGLAGLANSLPDGAVVPGLAADVIRTALRDARENLTLVGIGPATNLGLALATEPSLAANVSQIVLMSGACGVGNITPQAEFNAASDPEALAVLLGCGAPVVMATLELTRQALVTPARLEALRRGGEGPCLELGCAILGRSLDRDGTGVPLHDACTIGFLLRPDLFELRPAAIEVVCTPGPLRGRTLIDREPGASPHHVMERLDPDAFFALLGSRLSKLSHMGQAARHLT